VGSVTAWAGVCLKDAERGSYGGEEAAGLAPGTGPEKSNASTQLPPASQGQSETLQLDHPL